MFENGPYRRRERRFRVKVREPSRKESNVDAQQQQELHMPKPFEINIEDLTGDPIASAVNHSQPTSVISSVGSLGATQPQMNLNGQYSSPYIYSGDFSTNLLQGIPDAQQQQQQHS
ncbi:hypothetical protein B9Z55_021945 [Caenorhabditis nigoni]|uniref:Uncharacterized protein n=1 Tax=Caenorhabditis nigoni TaxID=1611254 RepID=A0A2G5TUC1_9PELO|nr:hypothetical protein B9Z55_021945 [Caenorhabditis nigoni]